MSGGASSTARASKSVPPAIGASRTSVVSSSMLTPWAARDAEISATMPGVVGAEQLEAEAADALALGGLVRALDGDLEALGSPAP